jgi:hypothetical protein
MRLWSLHPKYLDTKGLVALWREALLAKKVLQGRTKGYKHHPQLRRFKNSVRPVDALNQYLAAVYEEALRRGFSFDKRKIHWHFRPTRLVVTSGQLAFEGKHLRKKLRKRDRLKFRSIATVKIFSPHPLFRAVKGVVEEWEIV